MKRYTARGVVIGTLKYGEKGMVVQMLTSTLGRQSYMVQGLGSRRGHGSRQALFQPMFALEFEGLESPKMEMHRLGEVHAGIVLQSIPFDVKKKSAIALFMAEVLYRLRRSARTRFPPCAAGRANFHLWFLSNLCRFLGFSPGNEYMPAAWFDIAEGLYTVTAPPREHAMSQENAMILRDMLECDVRYLGEVGLNRRQRVDFLESLLAYYAYHLDTIHTVQSIRILQEVF